MNKCFGNKTAIHALTDIGNKTVSTVSLLVSLSSSSDFSGKSVLDRQESSLAYLNTLLVKMTNLEGLAELTMLEQCHSGPGSSGPYQLVDRQKHFPHD